MPKEKLTTFISGLRFFSAALFLVGLVWIGVLATGATMTFGWVGYGVAGAGAVLGLVWWRHPSSAPGLVRCLTLFAFCGYIVWRSVFRDFVAWGGSMPPVDYLARGDLVIVAVGLVAYSAGLTLWPRRRGRTALLVVLVLLLVGNFVFAVLQSKSMPWLHVLNSFGYERPTGDPSVGGFYILGNHLAGFLEVIGFILLGIGCFGRMKIGWRLLCFFGFVICGIMLAIAVSRGGAIAFGAGLGAFFLVSVGVILVRFRGRFGIWTWVFTVGAAGAMAAFLIAVNSEFLMENFRGKFLNQAEFREHLWEVTLEQYGDSPVVGTGSRSFEYYVRKQILPTAAFVLYSGSPEPQFAHNEYLQLLGDYGGIGLGLGFLVIAAHSVGGLRDVLTKSGGADDLALGRLSDRLALSVAGLAALVACGVHAALDFNFHIPANAAYFALALSALNLPRPRRSDARVQEAPPLAGRIALRTTLLVAAGVGAWLVSGAFRYAASEYHIMKGRSFEETGRPVQAEYHFAEAVARDPACYQAFIGQGFTRRSSAANEENPLLSRRWNIEALEAFHDARLLYPQNAYVYSALADTLSVLNAFDAADPLFAQALDLAPNHRDFWIVYGRHLTRKGDFPAALDAFQKALDLNIQWDDQRKEIQRWIRTVEKVEAMRKEKEQ